MKITQVEPQKRNPKRFNIFLDGEFAFGADEDLVVEYRLVKGKSLDTSDVEKLLFEAGVGKLMEKMYRWFSLRQHSEKEVREYFRVKNQELRIKGQEQISQLAIDAVVETLRRKGMVNDLEFTKAWVEARRRSKNLGIRALRMELYKKGIDKEIIEEVLSEPFDFAQGEEELAKKALEKKMKSWKNLNLLEYKKKTYEFLVRKGFEYEVIKEVIEKLARKE